MCALKELKGVQEKMFPSYVCIIISVNGHLPIWEKSNHAQSTSYLKQIHIEDEDTEENNSNNHIIIIVVNE